MGFELYFCAQKGNVACARSFYDAVPLQKRAGYFGEFRVVKIVTRQHVISRIA